MRFARMGYAALRRVGNRGVRPDRKNLTGLRHRIRCRLHMQLARKRMRWRGWLRQIGCGGHSICKRGYRLGINDAQHVTCGIATTGQLAMSNAAGGVALRNQLE